MIRFHEVSGQQWAFDVVHIVVIAHGLSEKCLCPVTKPSLSNLIGSWVQALQAQLRAIMVDFTAEEAILKYQIIHSLYYIVVYFSCIQLYGWLVKICSELMKMGEYPRPICTSLPAGAAETTLLIQKWRRNYGDEMRQRKARRWMLDLLIIRSKRFVLYK